MNIFEAMKKGEKAAQEREQAADRTANNAPDAAAEAAMMQQQGGDAPAGGMGFYNTAGGPVPLFKGYTGPGANIPDMDGDGIPDHIDYHFGHGQF
ncbi:MAG: hypothetical protein Q4F72_08420 [Desulfovibrionaceae bacterium]|nr:hypothetical protein [Desulfovibrionaceae bacterium]